MRPWTIFGIYTAFIVLVLIGAYMGVIPTTIAVVPMYDSIGHFVLYGIWFYLLHSALQRKTVASIPLAFLILFPLVVLEEVAQIFASTRTFSLSDLAWGFAGMCTFWLIATVRESHKH